MLLSQSLQTFEHSKAMWKTTFIEDRFIQVLEFQLKQHNNNKDQWRLGVQMGHDGCQRLCGLPLGGKKQI